MGGFFGAALHEAWLRHRASPLGHYTIDRGKKKEKAFTAWPVLCISR